MTLPKKKQSQRADRPADYYSLLQEGTRTLADAGIEDAPADAWYLLERVSAFDRSSYLLKKKEEVPREQQTAYRELLRLREKRIPLQHILGETEFMGYRFRVNEAVLIPRQETELLVEEAYTILKEQAKKRRKHQAGGGLRVLDLCTGSGCIAISLDLLCNQTERGPGNVLVCASDISPEALQVAEENARLNGAGVRFLRSDLFESIDGAFDLIVSNPPYIAKEQIDALSPEVRLHDPRIALDGGDDGLFFYRRISEAVTEHLFPGGILLLEIGYDQAEPVVRFLEEKGFENICVQKDLAGYDRIVSGNIPL